MQKSVCHMIFDFLRRNNKECANFADVLFKYIYLHRLLGLSWIFNSLLSALIRLIQI